MLDSPRESLNDHQSKIRPHGLTIEISTLLGLMVKGPVDFALPANSVVQGYLTRTEALLNELHQALQEPSRGGWFDDSGKLAATDPFEKATALREPIFYCGESAYSFQYRDIAVEKYRSDNAWLEAKRGFRIEHATMLADVIGRWQSARMQEWLASLDSREDREWTPLPAFEFSANSVAVASGVDIEIVQRFLDAFCYPVEERNKSFTSLNEFNGVNERPLLRTNKNSYVLLQQYSLLEAIYEAPFYWMADDKQYASIASANRGRFTEDFVANRLDAIFGRACVFRNLVIWSGKKHLAEIDTLVLFGDRAIVVQAKSKRLTIAARKGNDLQLKSDFKKAIQSAYDQAVLCARALIGDGFRFVSSTGRQMSLSRKPKVVFPICTLADHYPALAFQARQFLKLTASSMIQPPLVADVFAFDVVAEMLRSPLQFINYLTLRAQLSNRLFVNQESATLGFHLKHNLWFDKKLDGVNLGDEFAADLDIAMYARREAVPGEKTPKGILTRFEGLSIGRLLAQIEQHGPDMTTFGLFLLQLNSQTAETLNAGIDKIIENSARDGKNHDISVCVDDGASGITIHANILEMDEAVAQLVTHCKVRKYDAKSNLWFGVILDPQDGTLRGAVSSEEPWKRDPEMEAIMAIWPRHPFTPLSNKGAFGSESSTE